MEKQMGIFYGVSVGPGDPDLITLKAIRVLERCPVLAAPRTRQGGMLALEIAGQAVCCMGKEILPLDLPMTRNRDALVAAHQAAADAICARLAEGKDVAMPNLGDVGIYATCGYLAERIRARGYEVRLIPGVPSFCAVAARLGQSLTGGMDHPLTIAPGGGDLDAVLQQPGPKVLMKSGRQLPQVLDALDREGLLEQSAMVVNCGLEGEQVWPSLSAYDPAATPAGYFATILVKE